MRFSTKLYFGLGIIFVLITILIIVLMGMLRQQNDNMHVLVTDKTERIDAAYILKNEINNLSREIYELSSQSSIDLNDRTISQMEETRKEINKAYNFLIDQDKREETQELLVQFSTIYDVFEEKGQQIVEAEDKKMDSDFWIRENDEKNRLLEIATSLYSIQLKDMQDDLESSKKTYDIVVVMTYIYIIVGVVSSIAIAIYLIRGLTRNLNKVTTVMSGVSYKKGIKFPRLEIDSKDEVGEIARAFNEMVTTLEKYSKDEIESRAKAEEKSWLDSRLAEITTGFSMVETMESLADYFISQITPVVGAQYGIFYQINKQEQAHYLEEIAQYAFHDQGRSPIIQLGEGLVGQAAKENKSISLIDIPKEYIKIKSGSGEAEPKQVLIHPISYEGKVLAIVELASLQYFRPVQQRLLKEVVEYLGISIHGIINRLEVKRLLEDEQRLTEELQSQSEELQAQQQELMAINEELQTQYRVSEEKNADLEQIGKELEEKAEQLVYSSQYKSEFLANMSHELRTPLNSMLILSQMLVEKENENLNAKQIQYLQTIYFSGNELLRLINEILDLEKIETGMMEIIVEPVKMEEIQSCLKNQFAPIANKKKLDFSIKMAKEVPTFIETDAHRLNQVLKNLLSNAFKFTEKGRVELSIRLENSTKLANANEGVVSFTVKDTGIGIPKEKMDIIFEPFKQADGTISRRYGGTGLGLSICKEITHLLGGRLEAISMEGMGSSFSIYLPTMGQKQKDAVLLNERLLKEESYQQTAAAKEEVIDIIHSNENANLKGKKVLIIDDDIRNIFSIHAALEEYNIDILYAENGRDGISLLEANPDVDLVLMDIMMPEMSGLEAISIIRKKEDFKTLPIIAITAKAMKHNREQCIEAGASDYISKPVNLEQLYSLIQVWLYKE
ncbi:ATP-binding protein [Niallia circulans]|jgi:two-component system, chemotaxis family, sensor kinase CheA|uniref:hybrid sensor histidine kinase/response regulator n=1 Tax=Niallia circulans TaxID=1397 RepID=UPI001F2232F7|nr:ATP-binding protein [Niallia circulans]MCF2647195.1 response regulator [Niallia circulans]